MGFIRKATIITTGGLARGVIKPNSKKERIANAEEKRLKGQKMQERAAIRQAT